MSCWRSIKDLLDTSLQVATIFVLFVTWRAIRRQAIAADKLTTATDLQIETGREQARAAREQVEVARRQITEALRPILTCVVLPPVERAGGGSLQEISVQNNGSGVALGVWWEYGTPGIAPTAISTRNSVGNGLIPPHIQASLQVAEARAVGEGVMLIYESLAGIVSATTLQWNRNNWVLGFQPDVTDWARTLLGRIVGGVN